ncbi:MAG: hypothetical protein R2856_00310 [Caldilineaceae bacterium]
MSATTPPPHTIRWGIIGCGNVTEVKSGPAFRKIEGSDLVMVMRRDAALAEDYAQRHAVPRWTSDADALIRSFGVPFQGNVCGSYCHSMP